jgi:hypothetical protein
VSEAPTVVCCRGGHPGERLGRSRGHDGRTARLRANTTPATTMVRRVGLQTNKAVPRFGLMKASPGASNPRAVTNIAVWANCAPVRNGKERTRGANRQSARASATPNSPAETTTNTNAESSGGIQANSSAIQIAGKG